jgi:twitching motility protein PilT
MNLAFEHPALAQAGRDASLHDADPELLAALNDVVHLGGSDLHISVGSIPMVRVDGALRPGLRPIAWQLNKVVAAFNSILTEPQRQIFSDELELDFAYTVSRQTRFR